MRLDPQLPEVFLHRQPVDFRKSIDGLSAIVEMDMQQSPFSKQLYVFINKHLPYLTDLEKMWFISFIFTHPSASDLASHLLVSL